MAKKELVKVWDGTQIVEDNILFLKKTTTKMQSSFIQNKITTEKLLGRI